VHHGGRETAGVASSADNPPACRPDPGKPDLPFGAFGENLTVTGQTEQDVCIGDRWRLGEVRLEVSQPRLPCWKLARRWRIKDLALRVERTGRSGWDFRVLTVGQIAAGAGWGRGGRPLPRRSVRAAGALCSPL